MYHIIAFFSWIEHAYYQDPKEFVNFLLKMFGGGWAIWLLHRKISADRAQWVSTLYNKIADGVELRKARDTLDCKNGSAADIRIANEFVAAESSEFCDYLNFFEYVAYLCRVGQLRNREVEVLFGYYLDCLQCLPASRNYIHNVDKGYEVLSEFMNRRRRSQWVRFCLHTGRLIRSTLRLKHTAV